MKPAAFSFTANRLLRALIAPVEVAAAFSLTEQSTKPPQLYPFKAIWDTGATNTVITPTVVQQCGLKPISIAQVQGVHGASLTSVYLISIMLPHKVGFTGVRVTEGKFVGAEVLIGMDIISKGDFAISNFEGKTVFTFRSPSQGRIDFAPQGEVLTGPPMPLVPKVGRNDPCPCHSGKKYKHCCGKNV